ncbi:hypothetical protein TUM20985_34780 [Mycobacterium antarcticum]|uniref:DUF4192 domain-containing protein n=1 Tax=unclassified Mycolicibacterium TaxID=2636767 RepID=UPI002398EF7A|nr:MULTISPECIES: DUF4192 domain-containing protein [unclassified Mycolicibacterium]BDX32931.1 hypothetical protein TUM20985_34780 [Mycolicibacterium sp. TUM20985]GLP76109.1 hypothetical protein TUM20983_32190 [Mycolicibacterium sp. TUM20983]GLP83511.1 hypothetical protein TUM20984_49310 [Mycolicibacterium sp. TUM20984]
MTTFNSLFGAPGFHLDRPAALIAALPAVLGFIPEKSLVLVTVDAGELGCVMRVDLSAQLSNALAQMADVASSSGPDGAIAVIVDDDGASCRMCLDDHYALVEHLTERLDERDIDLLAAFVVDRLEAGGRWCRVDGHPGSGTIEDPMSSPMAAAAVLDGRRLYARRAELQEVIATSDAARSEALRAALLQAEHDGDLRPDADARGDVEHALAMARALSGGAVPADGDLARLGCGLTDPRVRDTLYALAVGRDADRAEALWAMLARTLPEPWRVEALVLLAFSAYARGDGPLAGVSLEAALRVDERHRMAGMLDQALQSGMRPEQIRELAQTGYRLAKRLGVRLPRRQGPGRRAG